MRSQKVVYRYCSFILVALLTETILTMHYQWPKKLSRDIFLCWRNKANLFLTTAKHSIFAQYLSVTSDDSKDLIKLWNSGDSFSGVSTEAIISSSIPNQKKSQPFLFIRKTCQRAHSIQSKSRLGLIKMKYESQSLFFWSFNPIHIGHMIIANIMAENTDLKKVWFVVSPQNPFKPSKGCCMSLTDTTWWRPPLPIIIN